MRRHDVMSANRIRNAKNNKNKTNLKNLKKGAPCPEDGWYQAQISAGTANVRVCGQRARVGRQRDVGGQADRCGQTC